MCNFASGIILQSGEVIESEYTDQHELIIEANNLKEATTLPGHNGFIRYEYSGSNPCDIETYVLHIDEESIPVWFSDHTKERVTEEIKVRTGKRILTKGKIPLLLGGKWVLGGDVEVDRIYNAIIISMHGSSSIGDMHGSSSIGDMHESSSIGDMHESSTIGVMHGSSSIGDMYDSSSIRAMRDSSSIGDMYESSSIRVMYDSSKVINDSRIKKD